MKILIDTNLLMILVCALIFSSSCAYEDKDPDYPNYDEDVPPPTLFDAGLGGDDCGYGYGGDCSENNVVIDCDNSPCKNGTCQDSETGEDTCKCNVGYTGKMCNECADGYEDNGLECVLSGSSTDPCSDNPCIRGTCSVDGDDFVCVCDEGYAGELCDECAVGYHLDGLNCVED